MKLAVLAVDPGGTTGVAWGTFDTELETVGESLKRGIGVGWGELTGGEGFQAAQIVGLWDDLSRLGGFDRIDLVIEDFVLRPGRATAGREMLSPVRITALVEGILIERTCGVDAPLGEAAWSLCYPEIVLQTPLAAKSFATKERLQRWGAWKKGMRHSRDAWRHIALRIVTVNK